MVRTLFIRIYCLVTKLIKPRFSIVRQYDINDCAPASLLSVLRYYGGDDSLVRVRQLTNTDSKGSTMLDLVKGARSLGFDVHGVTGRYEDLLHVNMPCIAHVIVDRGLHHFIVLYRVDNKKVMVGDPGKGLYKICKNDFLKIWKHKAVILLNPTEKLIKNKSQGIYSWIKQYMKVEESWLYQILFHGTLYTVFGLLTALFIQWMIDLLIPEGDFVKISLTGAFLFILLIMRAFTGYFRHRFLVILNKKINININTDFLNHLFQLPKRFFDTHKIGDITARMNDIVKIQQAILTIVGITIINLFIIFGSFIFMFNFSVDLAWITLIVIPLYVAILTLNVPKIKIQQRNVMKSYALVESMYFDSLKGIDDILSFNVPQVYANLNRSYFSNYQNNMEQLGFTHARLSLSAELFNAIIMISALTVGAVLVTESKLQLGEMIAAYSLLANMLPAVNSLVDASISFQGASIAIRRLMDLTQIEIENSNGKKEFQMNNSLRIKNGSFSWTCNKTLLLKINMELLKGQITGLWGANGSGKSTLVQIIQRKYYLSGGDMLLDDIPVKQFDLCDYRKHIGVVPTNVKIFNATLADNILLGRPVQNINHLKRRLDSVGLGEFIGHFEYDMFTLLGEDGRHFSEGEKQMIGLARALYALPDILILDEGINSLDKHTEEEMFKVLFQYAVDHAVLIITHNLRTLSMAHDLYLIKDGTMHHGGDAKAIIKQEVV